MLVGFRQQDSIIHKAGIMIWVGRDMGCIGIDGGIDPTRTAIRLRVGKRGFVLNPLFRRKPGQDIQRLFVAFAFR